MGINFFLFFYIIKQEFSLFADVLKDVKIELLNDLMELTGKRFHPVQSPSF